MLLASYLAAGFSQRPSGGRFLATFWRLLAAGLQPLGCLAAGFFFARLLGSASSSPSFLHRLFLASAFLAAGFFFAATFLAAGSWQRLSSSRRFLWTFS